MRYSYVRVAIILLALGIFAESERPKFREDYRYEKAFKAFYKLHEMSATWGGARVRCEAEGGELLVPDSLDEAAAMPLLVTAIREKHHGVFVGIHDLYSEKVYVMIKGYKTSGTILDLLWEGLEPKHGGGRCVAMRRNGRLFVHPCSDPLPFICKVKESQVHFYEECNTFNPNWKLGLNGTCYLTHQEPQDWSTAYATCLAAGGHLAVFNSRYEADYVLGLYKQVPERRMPDNDFAYIGFSDHFQRYHFRTVYGDPIEVTGYNEWEQKCSSESFRTVRRCGGVRRSGLLATEVCDHPAMFFCEKPSSGSLKLGHLDIGAKLKLNEEVEVED